MTRHCYLPQRIQMSRQRPWRAEYPGAVIVARPSRWGNPFSAVKGTVWGQSWTLVRSNWGLGVWAWHDVAYQTCAPAENAVPAAIDLFRTLCQVSARDYPRRYEEWIAPLRGRDLACWCPLGQPCHADVLLDVANGGRP